MERDNFQCQLSFKKDVELCVHHKYYTYGKMIWNYPDECLITISKKRHDIMHDLLNSGEECFRRISKDLKCTPTDVYIALYKIYQISNIEGEQGIKTAIELLTAYIIKQGEI